MQTFPLGFFNYKEKKETMFSLQPEILPNSYCHCSWYHDQDAILGNASYTALPALLSLSL